MSRGDILLFEAGDDLISKTIAKATGPGNLSHVGIDCGDGYIGSETIGVIYRSTPNVHNTSRLGGQPAPIWVVGVKSDAVRIEAGIVWLQAQVGSSYGWVDILADGLKLVKFPASINQPGHYDCSDLVSRYLTLIGAITSPDFNCTTTSPNDIARLFAVITPNTGQIVTTNTKGLYR